MREGLIAAFAVAIGVHRLVTCVAWASIPPNEWPMALPVGCCCPSSTLNIMTNIAGGMREFVLCYMPEGLIRPILFFIVICIAGIGGFGISAVSAMPSLPSSPPALAYAVSVQLRRKMPDHAMAPGIANAASRGAGGARPGNSC